MIFPVEVRVGRDLDGGFGNSGALGGISGHLLRFDRLPDLEETADFEHAAAGAWVHYSSRGREQLLPALERLLRLALEEQLGLPWENHPYSRNQS